MLRALNIAFVAAAVLSAFALYQVKYSARLEQQQIRQLAEQIAAEREAIQILRAEWSYLNQPERLQRLADRYLDLAPVHAWQVATFQDLPMPPRDPDLANPGRLLGGYAGLVPMGNPLRGAQREDGGAD